MPYRSVTHIENAVTGTAGGPNAAFTSLITLPEPTWEGRTTHAIRIGGGTGPRIGVYVVGGVHAREWGSADLLARLIEDLTQKYRLGQALTFGRRTFTATEVQRIVEGIDLYVFPQVNPDGRNHSMTTAAMWRKNRRPDPAPANVGVDVNRNFDFCWHYPTFFSPAAPVVSSTSPSSDVYIGPSAESEPETRNVVSILDGNPHIRFFVDVHSYGQLLLYGWGNDEQQGTDPAQSFTNPAFNGQRGVAGDAYAEYLPAPDDSLEQFLANRMRTGIVSAGGPSYTVQPSFGLYPTSGTSTERGLMRRFVDRAKGMVHGYTVEWGTEFQPPWATMNNIANHICAGLLEMCLAILDAHSDTYIRDNGADSGVSTATFPFWESPDVVLRPTDDGVFSHADPNAGSDAFMYVRVHNRGPNPTRELKVMARAVAYAGTEFQYPHDWTASDATHIAPTPIADTFTNVPVGGTVVARFRLSAAQVNQLGSWQSSGWHPCLLAEVDCVSDFARTGGTRVWQNNNLAQRNITVLPALAGATVEWGFLIGHLLDEADFSRLDIELVDVPRPPIVDLDLVSERVLFPAVTDDLLVRVGDLIRQPVTVGGPPQKVDTRTGIEVRPDLEVRRDVRPEVPGKLGPLVRELRGLRPVGDRLRITEPHTSVDLTRIPHKLEQAVISLTVPKEAQPGEVYRVRVAQRDGKGRVVGGVTLEVPVAG